MSSQIKWKFVLVAAVILACIYGLIGLPQFPTSLTQVKTNLADRIKLGLDLKGGSHLVLQVQLEEAVAQRCNEAHDDLIQQLHSKNITFSEVRQVDDTHILVRGIDPSGSGSLRDLITSQFTDWAMSPAPGEVNAFLLTMKPSVISDINTETMNQALETITRRINALGLTEPTIAFTGRGNDEILVQLPGVGDPDGRQGSDSGGRAALIGSRRRWTVRVRDGSALEIRWRSSSWNCSRARKAGDRSRRASHRGRFTTCWIAHRL